MLVGAAMWLLLGAGGCGNANHGDLFEDGPLKAGSAPNSGESGASGSGVAIAGGGSGGSENVAGSSVASAGSAGSNIGCAFACGDAGHGAGGSGGGSGSGGAETAGANAQAGSTAELTDCSSFAAGATFLPATQHCYLLDSEPRTFAAAQEHCTELKAHLITLENVTENDFAWSIHGDEHWIGAKDGKPPKQSGVGTYAWVTDEAFEYSNWSADQPNASKTECVDGGACYEHCAFQWKGGDRDSKWNDRYCLHTIASICEWDSAP